MRRRQAIGVTVRALRIQRGLTQRALADTSPLLSRRIIQRIESPDEDASLSISSDRLWVLADGLGVELSELIALAEREVQRPN